MCNERNEMANAVSLFLNYPQFLIVTGTAMLILGLLGFALFIPSDVESAEDRLAERPRLFDKSEPLFGEAEGEQAGFAYDRQYSRDAPQADGSSENSTSTTGFTG
jgi:hypothetical protein